MPVFRVCLMFLHPFKSARNLLSVLVLMSSCADVFAVGDAKLGDAEALFAAGRASYKGEGAALDYAKAADYFLKAAEADHVKAQTTLGTMLVEGRGVPKDFATATRWLTKAAAQGDATAKLNLGWMALEGLGGDRDPAAAVRWYRGAAEAGLAEAQLRLGDLYFWGKPGIERDLPEAVKWLEKAAAQGVASAQNTLGVMRETAEVGSQNFGEAVRLFRAAAEQGDARAQMNLGRMYANGTGVEKDLAAACYWFVLSINGREPSGEKQLQDLLVNGKVTLRQIAEARVLAASFTPKSRAPLP